MSTQDTRIETVQSGAGVNSWIIGDDDEVIVVDPGSDATAVFEAVGDRVVLAVICTHGHVGHCGAALAVAERDGAPVALHPADRQAWRDVHDTAPDIDMEDGGIFEVGDVTLEVLHAPGHSRGSVCLFCEELDVVFAGDVISETGPVARDDGYPNWGKQLDAIGGQILTLPGTTRILPGHGAEFTVAMAEKRFDSWVSAGQDAQVVADLRDSE
jgi:glyoxylase-like metal-dependent hydrolase (beta-lactamase superfamily II)